jgi:hypothetical protein
MHDARQITMRGKLMGFASLNSSYTHRCWNRSQFQFPEQAELAMSVKIPLLKTAANE